MSFTYARRIKQKGAMFVMFALILPTMLLLMGLAIDMGILYVYRTKLQDVADATVMAVGADWYKELEAEKSSVSSGTSASEGTETHTSEQGSLAEGFKKFLTYNDAEFAELGAANISISKITDTDFDTAAWNSEPNLGNADYKVEYGISGRLNSTNYNDDNRLRLRLSKKVKTPFFGSLLSDGVVLTVVAAMETPSDTKAINVVGPIIYGKVATNTYDLNSITGRRNIQMLTPTLYTDSNGADFKASLMLPGVYAFYNSITNDDNLYAYATDKLNANELLYLDVDGSTKKETEATRVAMNWQLGHSSLVENILTHGDDMRDLDFTVKPYYRAQQELVKHVKKLRDRISDLNGGQTITDSYLDVSSLNANDYSTNNNGNKRYLEIDSTSSVAYGNPHNEYMSSVGDDGLELYVKITRSSSSSKMPPYTVVGGACATFLDNQHLLKDSDGNYITKVKAVVFEFANSDSNNTIYINTAGIEYGDIIVKNGNLAIVGSQNRINGVVYAGDYDISIGGYHNQLFQKDNSKTCGLWAKNITIGKGCFFNTYALGQWNSSTKKASYTYYVKQNGAYDNVTAYNNSYAYTYNNDKYKKFQIYTANTTVPVITGASGAREKVGLVE